MTLTHQVKLFALRLSCGHVQLATKKLPVGSNYPCWTACSEDNTPTSAKVVEASTYFCKPNDVFLQVDGGSDEDIRRATEIAQEANGVSNDKVRGTISDLLNEMLAVNIVRTEDFLGKKIAIQGLLGDFVKEDPARWGDIEKQWRALGSKSGTLLGYMEAVINLRALL